ncbi:unnamed protein product [Linum trigynum]|uniref:Uncharacterized protein n=1 Tax=Linum trigynum TaxID=586398 RepID=A0AAV2G9D1_9ROSI
MEEALVTETVFFVEEQPGEISKGNWVELGFKGSDEREKVVTEAPETSIDQFIVSDGIVEICEAIGNVLCASEILGIGVNSAGEFAKLGAEAAKSLAVARSVGCSEFGPSIKSGGATDETRKNRVGE